MALYKGFDLKKDERELYEGQAETVRILCCGHGGETGIVREFGPAAEPLDAWEPFRLYRVETVVCYMFFSWLRENAASVRLVGPDWVRMEYQKELIREIAFSSTLFARRDLTQSAGLRRFREDLSRARNNLLSDYICWDGVETERLSCRELAEDVKCCGARRHCMRTET